MFLKTEERPQGEVHETRKLKLSEAIRIGAKLRPQCFGQYFSEGRSCALGAAWEGAGFKGEPPIILSWVERVFGTANAIGLSVAQRNDSGHSREEISDWLASQGL